LGRVENGALIGNRGLGDAEREVVPGSREEGKTVKVVIIGGGIAGVSAAYALMAADATLDVLLVEAEPSLSHHTTGRSAAQLILNYGAAPLRALSKASLDFLHHPPEGLVDHPLLDRRAVLSVGTADQADSIDRLLAEGRAIDPSVEEITVEQAQRLFPPLRAELMDRAVLEVDSYDIDVAGLHQAFVRGARAAGARLQTTAAAVGLDRVSGRWMVSLADDGPTTIVDHFDHVDRSAGIVVEADVVVNAAGAWGDVVAARAGVAPVGLQPMRRTAFMTPSRHPGSASWPLLVDADHNWYVKPDGSQFLCSPADEQPSEPCDAKPEEIDVARAIDRINTATTMDIRHVSSSWAGLRTFTSDRSMVVGPDRTEPSFIWCVGQGGTGIQTAPATGRLVADLVLTGRPGESFGPYDLDLDNLLPDRFRTDQA